MDSFLTVFDMLGFLLDMIVENPALSFFVALSVIGMGYLQWRDRHFWRGGEWRNDEATPIPKSALKRCWKSTVGSNGKKSEMRTIDGRKLCESRVA
ncbi:MAG: hypothetical protein BRD45_03660 [Bacteroidetes bacterium QS_8_64_10]|jgi:hypothetical protein|nr:MAG: hypothetical protein BRD45_03660 [Bacteroidetes bacterium QS_8_64_10]